MRRSGAWHTAEGKKPISWFFVAASLLGCLPCALSNAIPDPHAFTLIERTSIVITIASVVLFAISIAKRDPRWTVLPYTLLVGLGIGGILHVRAMERAWLGATKCPRCLASVGLAILLYADKHHGQLPASLESAVLAEDMSPEVLVCPNTSDRPATGNGNALAAELKKPGHDSYIYLGSGKTTADFSAANILAYDRPENHAPAGVYALFGDGHVEYVAPELLKEFLERPRPTAAVTQPATAP